MTKIQEVHELLQNIQSNVSEKLEEQEKRYDETTQDDPINKKHPFPELAEEIEHTKGQLYEVNYILDNFWNIISK